MTEITLSTDANTKKTYQPASSARSGRSSFDWQVQPGQDAHPVVESVLSGLHLIERHVPNPIGG
jgi:hypothetical protein